MWPAGMTGHPSSCLCNSPRGRQASAVSRSWARRTQRTCMHGTHGGDGRWLRRASGGRRVLPPGRDTHFTPPFRNTANKYATKNKTWALCSLHRPPPLPSRPSPGSLSAEPRPGPGSAGWGLLTGDWPEAACVGLLGEEGAKGRGVGEAQAATVRTTGLLSLWFTVRIAAPHPRCEMRLQTGREITTGRFLSSD